MIFNFHKTRVGLGKASKKQTKASQDDEELQFYSYRNGNKELGSKGLGPHGSITPRIIDQNKKKFFTGYRGFDELKLKDKMKNRKDRQKLIQQKSDELKNRKGVEDYNLEIDEIFAYEGIDDSDLLFASQGIDTSDLDSLFDD